MAPSSTASDPRSASAARSEHFFPHLSFHNHGIKQVRWYHEGNRCSAIYDFLAGDYLGDMSNMKVNKLLFLGQGQSYLVRNKPLFDDEIEA